MTSAGVLLGECSLRERKRARLRVGLWNALRNRIEETPFHEISVRELAAAIEVSEPTFFAHFATKTELLSYHISMWRVGTGLAASGEPDGLPFLRRFLDETSRSIVEGPRMWFEITGEVARQAGLCGAVPISAAERLLVFDDPAALDVAVTPQAELFEHHLVIAAANGDLATTVPDAVTGLVAGFYGVPLAVGVDRLGDLAATYRAHLERFVAPRRRRR